MPIRRPLACLIATLVILLCACRQPEGVGQSGDTDPIILKIGHTEVTLAEYRFYLAKNYPELEKESDDELFSYIFDQFKRDLLIAEISQILGFGITSDQVDTFIRYTMTGMSFNLLDPREQVLWRGEIKRRLAIQQFLEREILESVSIADETVAQRLESRKGVLKKAVMYHLRFMQAKSEEKARAFLKELKSAKSLFKEAAGDYSENEGYRLAVPMSPNDLPPSFRKAVERMKPGQHSKVIPMSQGDETFYYVLYLEYIESSEQTPDDEAFRQIRSEMAREQSRALLDQKIRQFGDKIPILVYKENLPFSYIEPADRKEV